MNQQVSNMFLRTFLCFALLANFVLVACGELPAEPSDSAPAGTGTDAIATPGIDLDFQGGAFGGPPQQAPLPALGGTGETHDFLRAPACPAGQIPWTFRGRSIGEFLYELARVRQDEEHEDDYERALQSITLESVTCGGNEHPGDAELLRQQCAGRTNCMAPVQCRGDLEVRYSCGAAGDEIRVASSAFYGTFGNLRRVEMACSFPSATPPIGTRTTCVPALCRGKTRRNADLQCVPDFTMPVFDARIRSESRPDDIHFFTPIPPVSLASNLESEAVWRWELQNEFRLTELYARPNAMELLFERGLYDITTRLRPQSEANREALRTPDLRATLWFSDVYYPSRTSVEEIEVFRCVGKTFEIEEQSNGTFLLRSTETQLASGCFGDRVQRASLEAAFRKATGLPLPVDHRDNERIGGLAFDHTRVHLSLDLEGRTLVITDPFDEATACAPNPPEMFYDRGTDRHDQLTYHKQRRIHTFMNPRFPRETRRFRLTHAPQITLGVSQVELRDPVITAYQFTRIPTYLSLDVSWFTAFETLENPFSSAGFRTSEGQTETGNHALQDIEIQLFLYEHTPLPGGVTAAQASSTAREGMPLLARRRVSNAEPTGSTVSMDVVLTPEQQARFFDSSSRTYIPFEFESRRFEVLACIVTGNDRRVSLRPVVTKPFDPTWRNVFLAASNRIFHPHISPPYAKALHTPPTSARDPWNGPMPAGLHPLIINQMNQRFTRRNTPWGCAWADRPLIVQPDRYVRAVEPVLDRAWRGQVGEQLSGDPTVETEAGDQMGQTCEQLPGATAESCMASIGNDGRSDGNEFSDPLSEFDGFLRNLEGALLRAEGIMSVFGFQVMDTQGVEVDLDQITDEDGEPIIPSSPITFELDYDDGGLKLTIYPPFEDAAERLNLAMGNDSKVKWEGEDDGELALGLTKEKQVKIGPIPGTVFVTISSGIELNAWFEYRWRRRTGEEYACLGADNTCYVLFSGENAMTFPDAVAHCASGGGRLAAPTSVRASQQLRQLRRGVSENLWVGGQLGTRFEDIQCLQGLPNNCRSPVFRTARWVQGDVMFIDESGSVLSAPVGINRFVATPFNFVTGWFHGLMLDSTDTLRSWGAANQVPFVCEYDPASDAQYRQVGAGIDTSVNIALTLGFCTPNSNLGICIEGNLKFIQLGLEPTFSKDEWTLVGAAGFPSRKLTNIDVDVTLAIDMLIFELKATLKAWIFSRSWSILRYPGLRLLEQTLYAYNFTSEEVIP